MMEPWRRPDLVVRAPPGVAAGPTARAPVPRSREGRTARSEDEPHPQLCLAGIAQPAAHGAVEVEQQRAGRRVTEVVGVGEVEDVEDGLERAAPAEPERPREAHVPGEELVLLAQGVAWEDGPVRTDPLGGAGGALAGARVARAALL